MDKAKVYLDTSALFAGIWSAEGGARMVLKLGEAGAIKILLSHQVLTEIEAVVRKKAPRLLGALSILIERTNAEIVPSPEEPTLNRSRGFVSHPGDVLVIAVAWEARVDYFVSLDRIHFLDNQLLRKAVPFPIGTPGDFLTWLREQFQKGNFN
jgi:predicted nucleic acid-binding protein